MPSMGKIRRKYGGPVCRACLNDINRVHLRHKNCVFLPEPGLCPRCHGSRRNLVKRLRLSGMLKLLLR